MIVGLVGSISGEQQGAVRLPQHLANRRAQQFVDELMTARANDDQLVDGVALLEQVENAVGHR